MFSLVLVMGVLGVLGVPPLFLKGFTGTPRYFSGVLGVLLEHLEHKDLLLGVLTWWGS